MSESCHENWLTILGSRGLIKISRPKYLTYPNLTAPLKWYCAVKLDGTILAKSTVLSVAQKSLGIGSRQNRQAIIPMEDQKAGDPHTLHKQWSGGSMWWSNWSDINKMREFCKKATPPGGNYVKHKVVGTMTLLQKGLRNAGTVHHSHLMFFLVTCTLLKSLRIIFNCWDFSVFIIYVSSYIGGVCLLSCLAVCLLCF